ncbi:MAG: polysaccharide pyruvyl transferase family protein [Acutalibacteraceae bacterium]
MEKRFLILPGCDDKNRGDQALIWETVEIAEKAGYNGQFYMLADENNSSQSKAVGIKNFFPILKHPSRKNSGKDNVKYSMLLTLRWGITSLSDMLCCEPLVHKGFRKIIKKFLKDDYKQSIDLFEQAEACFVKGGGFLHAYGGLADTYKIYYFLYHIRMALSCGKDVYIMPNSFGPFKSPLVKKMLNRTLSKCKVVMSREHISQKQLEEQCNVKSYLFTDIAFHLPKDDEFDSKKELADNGIPLGQKKCVGLTMRPYRFTGAANPDELYHNYKKSLVDFIQWLCKNNYYPVLIEHVYDEKSHENDMACIQEVIEEIPDGCKFSVFSNRQLNCMQMKKIYSELDYLVGTRFHSVIFSLSSMVPSVAITYGGNKGDGIMKDFNLSEYAIPIDRIDGNLLIGKFESLIENEDEVNKIIKESVSNISNQVDEIVNLIK